MIKTILLLAAFVCFLLAALNVTFPKVNLTGAGLALLTASMLFPIVITSA